MAFTRLLSCDTPSSGQLEPTVHGRPREYSDQVEKMVRTVGTVHWRTMSNGASLAVCVRAALVLPIVIWMRAATASAPSRTVTAARGMVGDRASNQEEASDNAG
jgi:hypothetical protein